MIRRAMFRNFMALRDVDIQFTSRLTVFVGPNGSGKSSVLRGLHHLCQFAGGKTGRELYRGGYRYGFLYSTDGKGDMILGLEVDGPPPRALIARTNLVPAPTFEEPDGVKWDCVVSTAADLKGHDAKAGSAPTLNMYRSAVLLKLDAARLAAPSYSDDPVPRVEYDGTGLPSALAFLALNQPDHFQAIVESLRRVVPTVRGVRFERLPVIRKERIPVSVDGRDVGGEFERRMTGDALLIDFVGAQGIPAHLVSEGTLLALGLLTVIAGPNRPRTLMLDDLDQALHPTAQTELIRVLQDLLQNDQQLQIVGTSHSLYVLDQLKEEEVRVMTIGKSGSICGRLSEHPDYMTWKESMSPGEFWSHVGEDWLLKRQAAVAH